MKLTKVVEWSGSYNGFTFSLKKWYQPFDDRWIWNIYIYLVIDRIPKLHDPESFWLERTSQVPGFPPMFDYFSHPIINQLFCHCGGVTWYSQEHGSKGERIIKLGCDFNHSWDSKKYHFNTIKRKALTAIDELRELIPNYKYWCCGNGKLYFLHEGIIKDDKFYSFEYYGKDLNKITSVSKSEKQRLGDQFKSLLSGIQTTFFRREL